MRELVCRDSHNRAPNLTFLLPGCSICSQPLGLSVPEVFFFIIQRGNHALNYGLRMEVKFKLKWKNLYSLFLNLVLLSVQFSSVAQSYPTLCNPMDGNTPGFPVHHQLLELSQNHVLGDAIQTSHPLSSPSPPTFNLSQYQGLFKWVSSSYQVAKVLQFQLQHQSFQWIFRTNFL